LFAPRCSRGRNSTRTPRPSTRAVFVALARLVRGDEIEDLLAQFPRGYQEALLKIYETAR
jgi:uncharacterized protein (DUF2267 family)